MADSQQKPPLDDPLHEKELFASEIVGAVVVHGVVVITLANIRLEEPIGDAPPKMRRAVAGRIALTGVAAKQLLDSLQNIAAKTEKASDAVAVAGKKSK
jgi:hypothetical protein